MALTDMFTRKRPPLDGSAGEGEGVSPISGTELTANEATRKKQRMLLAGVAGVGLLASSFWIFGGDDKKSNVDPDAPQKVEVSTKDLVNRNLSQQEWMALSENRMQSTENQLKAVNGEQAKITQLAEQVEALKAQNQAMQADGQRVLAAYQAENDQLRRQASSKPAPAPAPASLGPTAMYGPSGPAAYQRPGGPAGPAAGGGASIGSSGGMSEVKMVNFTTANSGTATKVEKGSTVYTDSPNYLPPNSFATAKVIVGVDASAGVNSQTDPLPVVLRVTGPARSVFQNGRLLTTKIQGCLINGAARGDLSSEKVYVKLQKMASRFGLSIPSTGGPSTLLHWTWTCRPLPRRSVGDPNECDRQRGTQTADRDANFYSRVSLWPRGDRTSGLEASQHRGRRSQPLHAVSRARYL